MAYRALHRMMIDGDEQWVLVQGANSNLPLLLLVQGGPGLPIICDAKKMQHGMHLEKHFLVAYWDQRSCGKSFKSSGRPEVLGMERTQSDIVACVQFLLHQYQQQKVYACGFSIGASFLYLTAARQPELFHAVFLSAMMVNVPAADRHALHFAQQKAEELGNDKLYAEITGLLSEPIITAKKFMQRTKVLTNLGVMMKGVNFNQMLLHTLQAVLTCKDYRLTEKIAAFKGMEFCQNAVLKEIVTFAISPNTPCPPLPVHIMHGTGDGVSPYKEVFGFYSALTCPSKSFHAFNGAAHMLHAEQPEKFADILISAAL